MSAPSATIKIAHGVGVIMIALATAATFCFALIVAYILYTGQIDMKRMEWANLFNLLSVNFVVFMAGLLTAVLAVIAEAVEKIAERNTP